MTGLDDDSNSFLIERLEEAGFSREAFPVQLRVWDGPLAGVAHQAGQFALLEEGDAAQEAGAALGEEQAAGLLRDLELLSGLAPLAAQVMYSASGSEADFGMLPVILQPAAVGAAGAAGAAGGGAAGEGAAGEGAAAGSGAGGGGSCGGGLGSAMGASLGRPLSAEEVAASLGVAPGLAARFHRVTVLGSKEAFLGHMREKHIRGAEEDGEPPQGEEDPDGIPAALRRSKAALTACVEQLAEAVAYPVLQVTLGSEELRWNPIPIMWVGRSACSGCIVGLLTAVVWT